MPAASSVVFSCSCCFASAPAANEFPTHAASLGNIGVRLGATGAASERL